jgi:hypothetical protein
VRALVLAVLLAGCSDEPAPDLGAPLDLLGPDLPVELPDLEACTPSTFGGFDTSATEQRFDCAACGCLVDSLDDAATSPWWTRDLVSTTLSDGAGLDLVGMGEPASATLRSTFYLDGDFDLRIDATIDSGQATLSFLEGDVATAVSTTLRLVRHGTTLTAYANGAMQASTTSPARVPIELVGRDLPCDASGCLELRLANLRLASGALVDRAP